MVHTTIVRGDITCQEGIEAIVNAAHPSLLGGGGVDGAIHRAAGDGLVTECLRAPVIAPDDVDAATKHVLTRDAPWRASQVRCPVGEAFITRAYGGLPCLHVIHTVGPLYPGWPVEDSARLLARAYENSLLAAKRAGCRTVAFPAISCGVFGYPLAEAAKIALDVVRSRDWDLDEVRFVMFEEAAYVAFAREATPPVDIT